MILLSLSLSVLLRPRTRGMRVAAFIGNTNFLPAVYLTADLFVARASPAAGNGEEDDGVNDARAQNAARSRTKHLILSDFIAA